MRKKAIRGIFITGTDTSVGKTSVAAGLAFSLAGKNLSVGVMKPVQTGSRPARGSVLSGDALTLSRAAHVEAPGPAAARNICPYSFPEPLAPLLASRRHRRPIRLATLLKSFREISKEKDFVIVEGAGGLFSPFTLSLNSLKLALRLDLPLLIVAENRIGALNQVLMTIENARASGAKIAGVVFNQVKNHPYDRAGKTNPGLFKEVSNVPVWGVIPFISSRPGKKRWERMEKYLKGGLSRLNGTKKLL